MGYNPHIVASYKVTYGKEIAGYSYEYDEFSEFLDKIGVDYDTNDAMDEHEISSEGLLKLEGKLDSLKLNEDERDNLINLIEAAKTAEYAKNGYLKLHWF